MARLFPGGLRAADFLFELLTGSNTTGLANSDLTAQVPLPPAGIIPDATEASEWDPSKPFPALHGFPGEDTGGLPGTQHIVMRFTKGSKAKTFDGGPAFGQPVIVDAADVLDAWQAGGIQSVQALIDNAQYVPA